MISPSAGVASAKISAASRTCKGDAESKLSRLIKDPVTMISSIASSASSACAWKDHANAPNTNQDIPLNKRRPGIAPFRGLFVCITPPKILSLFPLKH